MQGAGRASAPFLGEGGRGCRKRKTLPLTVPQLRAPNLAGREPRAGGAGDPQRSRTKLCFMEPGPLKPGPGPGQEGGAAAEWGGEGARDPWPRCQAPVAPRASGGKGGAEEAGRGRA